MTSWLRERPEDVARTLIALLTLLLLLPAAAQAASWSAPQTATRAGFTSTPRVAVDRSGRVAVGWTRELRGVQRTEVRRGTLRRGLSGGAVVFDTDRRHTLPLGDLAWTGDGDEPLAVLWLKWSFGNRRVAVSLLDHASAKPRAGYLVTGPSQPAIDPRFFPGTTVAAWSRSTYGEVLPDPLARPQRLEDGARGAAFALRGDGTVAVASRESGQLTFGGVVLGDAPGDVGATTASDGVPVVAFTTAEGGIRAAREGSQAVDLPAGSGAHSLRIVSSAAGELLVAYVDGLGIGRLQRLTALGQPVGTPLRLSGDGVRLSQLALTAGDPTSAYAGWVTRGGTAQALRIAPGGLVGRRDTLGRGTPNQLVAFGASAPGVVMAWIRSGDVQVARRIAG